jgi:hypothetical protein
MSDHNTIEFQKPDDRRRRRLSELREAAAQALPEEAPVPNRLVDSLGPRGTVSNARQVLAFLEASRLFDQETNEQAEIGRWHVHWWLIDALEHAEKQMERESQINCAIIDELQAGEKS